MKRSAGDVGSGAATRATSQERNDDGGDHKRRRYSKSTPDKKPLDRTTNPTSSPAPSTGASQMMQRETDERKLAQRQKQIDFGKNTIGYDRYLQSVPKPSRQFGTHPSTPDKYAVASKRAWDGRIQAWRRHLHLYDPESTAVARPAPPSTSTTSSATTPKRPSDSPRSTPSTASASRVVQASLFDAFDDDIKTAPELVDEDDLL